jgi:hypothetical protein
VGGNGGSGIVIIKTNQTVGVPALGGIGGYFLP